MPKIENKNPELLRPYLYHGLDLTWKSDTSGEATGDCPFCGRGGKFSVNLETGLWRCFVCAEGSDKGGGNAHTFIRKLWELSDKVTDGYDELASERGFLNPDSLMTWGVCKSAITNEWIIPGYGINRHLNQLYKYIDTEGRMVLRPTPTLGHQIFGLNGTFDLKKQSLWVCEGPWDAIALWEVASQIKNTDMGYVPTSNRDASLLRDVNVIAIPGCETLFDHWYPLFSGKNVWFMLDNDHDRRHPKTGAIIPAAAYKATQRHVAALAGYSKPPAKMEFLQWSGEAGKSFDPELPPGHDIRDELTSAGDALGDRIPALKGLIGLMTPVPAEWLSEASRASTTHDKKGNLGTLKCESYKTLINTWRKAVKMTEGVDIAISVSLACVTSTMQIGDQLWIKMIGPPSSLKSTICEAISTASKYVVAKSTIKGFYSGWKEGEAGGKDYSLIAEVNRKTLIIKDGDTLLQLPNRAEILSQARDLYDTVSRSSFKTAASKDYKGIRMTLILAGTSALRGIDASELGGRFVDVVLMDGIDDDLEDEILWRVAHRAEREMSFEADGEAVTHQSPEMTAVMQLTGGYVEYLRENATDLLSQVEMDDEAKRLCTRLGKFVAFMRARPSVRQDENAEREFAARLVSQHIRLAKCLAVVLNSKDVCKESMRRTTKVALDTSRGVTLELVKALYHGGEDGMTLGGLSKCTSRTEARTSTLLRFLRRIGVVDFQQTKKNGVTGHTRWKLTKKLTVLYYEVTGEEIEDGS